MAAREITLRRQHQAVTKVCDVLAKHAPEVAEELRLLTPGGTVPNSARTPDELMTYFAEAIVALAEVVDELVEANRPKKRGRPPKDRTQEAS
jgi:hypothetical protein